MKLQAAFPLIKYNLPSKVLYNRLLSCHNQSFMHQTQSLILTSFSLWKLKLCSEENKSVFSVFVEIFHTQNTSLLCRLQKQIALPPRTLHPPYRYNIVLDMCQSLTHVGTSSALWFRQIPHTFNIRSYGFAIFPT